MSAFARIIPALIEAAQRQAAARIAQRFAPAEHRWRKAALLWPQFSKD